MLSRLIFECASQQVRAYVINLLIAIILIEEMSRNLLFVTHRVTLFQRVGHQRQYSAILCRCILVVEMDDAGQQERVPVVVALLPGIYLYSHAPQQS